MAKTQKWFITGTDTDAGKTYVGQHIMQGLAGCGYTTLGYKPLSAGCERINGQLINDDAKQYQQNSTIRIPIQEVNPIAYEAPIAPHLAAAKLGEQLSSEQIKAGLAHLQTYQPDIIVTEGAGGWRLPLGNGRYLSEFPVQEKMKVILVVGLKLGCLNHAILTAQAIQADGAHFAGWVGNHIDADMLYQEENIATLKECLGEPLGIIPHGEIVSADAQTQLVQNIASA